MKHFKNLSIIVIALTLTVFACKKSTDSVPDPSYKKATPKKAYEKRWNITGSLRTSQTNATTNIIAVEFMLSTYILYFSGDSIITGTYTETNPTTLELTGYGTLTINSITGSAFGFTLVSTIDGTSTITSAAAPSVPNSPNTLAFCNTWKITSYTNSFFGPGNLIEQGDESYITMSQYGTYLTKEVYGTDSTVYGTNTWQWTDTKQDKFCYGKWDGQNITNCDTLPKATVVFKEGNSKCTVTENIYIDFIDSTVVGVYEMEVQ